MRKVTLLSLMFSSALFISSCAEVALLGAGVVIGGAGGYYAGKEGYKVKVEKEK